MNTITREAYESDIVSRLRNWRGLHLAHSGRLFEDAADEIERLRNGSPKGREMGHQKPLAWAVVNRSGGTRFLGLTSEDAQRVATSSELVVPVHWPTLTDDERQAIAQAIDSLSGVEDMSPNASTDCRNAEVTLRGLLERLA